MQYKWNHSLWTRKVSVLEYLCCQVQSLQRTVSSVHQPDMQIVFLTSLHDHHNISLFLKFPPLPYFTFLIPPSRSLRSMCTPSSLSRSVRYILSLLCLFCSSSSTCSTWPCSLTWSSVRPLWSLLSRLKPESASSLSRLSNACPVEVTMTATFQNTVQCCSNKQHSLKSLFLFTFEIPNLFIF